MRINRLWIFMAALVLVAGAAWFAVHLSGAGENEENAREETERSRDAANASQVEMAQDKLNRADIEIATAGPTTLHERLQLYGRIGANEDQLVQIQPRFPGVVRSIRKRLGDTVARDEVIATIESNQSLTTYDLRAPIAGSLIEKNVSLGEYVGDQTKMFVIANLTNVWVDFSVYRQDVAKIRVGQPVRIDLGGGLASVQSTISYISPLGAPDTQTMLARAVVDNPNGALRPGLFVTGEVALDELPVPVAVESQAIQTIDGRPVVFVREADRFEVRTVELGRQDSDCVEVLSGLKPGEKYAGRNSFVVKAELGKSASDED